MNPSTPALRAAHALSNAGKLHRQPESVQKIAEAAALIDRETGLAALLAERDRLRAALVEAEHGYNLLAHNLSLYLPGSSLIDWAKRGECDAADALSATPPAAPSEAEQVNGEALDILRQIESEINRLGSPSVGGWHRAKQLLARAAQAKGGK